MKKLLPAPRGEPKGFTLIELLVVITIIAILALIGLVTYSNVQSHARDTKRKVDMDAIAKALEANYTATSSAYPTLEDSMFVGKQPTAQDTTNFPYTYSTLPNVTFTVCAKLEKQTGNAISNVGADYDTNKTNGDYYCVKNQR